MDVASNQHNEKHYVGTAQNVSNFERGLSIGIGALLIYSAVKRFRRTPVRSVLRAAVGAGLALRGASGICPIYSKLHVDGTKTEAVNFRTTLNVNKPRMEVYSAWRNLGTLPRFMKHLKNVTEISKTKSHWEVKIPEGSPLSISWDAEIVKDEPGSFLAWKSVDGSKIYNAGKIEFHDALGGHGTELRVTIIYHPLAGNLGAGVAKLFNPMFKKLIRNDVNGFKQYIELFQAGTVADGFR